MEPLPSSSTGPGQSQDGGYLNGGQPCTLFACDSSGHWQQLPHCP